MQEIKSQVKNPEKELGKAIKSRYGRFSYIEEYQKNDGKFEVKVGFKIPRTYNDSKDGKIYYKHLSLDNIATVKADYRDESLRIEGPGSEEVSNKVQGRISGLRKKIEQRLVSATAEKLVELPGVAQDFSKVRKLLRELKRNGQTDLEDFIKNETKAHQYIELLESLDYVEVDDNLFSESDKLKNLRHDEEEDTEKKVIEDIITNRLEYVKDFQLNNVLPYIRIVEAYYFAVYQTGDDLDMNISQVERVYRRYHGKRKTEYYLRQKIQDLVEVGILEMENSYYTGNPSIADKVVSNALA